MKRPIPPEETNGSTTPEQRVPPAPQHRMGRSKEADAATTTPGKNTTSGQDQVEILGLLGEADPSGTHIKLFLKCLKMLHLCDYPMADLVAILAHASYYFTRMLEVGDAPPVRLVHFWFAGHSGAQVSYYFTRMLEVGGHSGAQVSYFFTRMLEVGGHSGAQVSYYFMRMLEVGQVSYYFTSVCWRLLHEDAGGRGKSRARFFCL